MPVVVELARPEDIPGLPDVERDAATLFAGYGLPASILEETTPLGELRHAAEHGRLWVARGDDGAAVGFALVELVDGAPHLEEVDVRPSSGRRGLGRALVEAVLAWARAAGHDAVTLTTFREVAWNAPFYARLGFRPVAEDALGPGLAAVVADETARGLDPARRVVMRCDVRAR
jgi:GNAT superfamily N-acetyltransferase